MLTIHHLGVSQSERVIWLCEELRLTYTLKRYERTRLMRLAPPEYQALHPMGTAPIVDIDGTRLAESGAIIEYIVHRHGSGRLAPQASDPTYAAWLFWFHFANASLMASELSMLALRAVPWSGYVRKAMQRRSDKAFALTEARLGQAPWLAGKDFTTADIIMAFPFSTMRAFSGRKLDGYPNIRAWLARIGARPAYQRAMSAGDPGMKPLLV